MKKRYVTKETAIKMVRKYLKNKFIPLYILTLPDKYIVCVSEDGERPAYDGLYQVDRDTGRVSGYSQFSSTEALEEFKAAFETMEKL